MSHKYNVNTAKYIVGLTAISTVYTSLALRRKALRQLAEEGQLPVTLPADMPGHFTRALRSKVAVHIREDAELSGLWLAFYGQSAVLRLEGTARSLRATHLTGNAMVPAGAPAFEVCREDSGELLGTGTASFLPRGLWLVRRPCRVHGYREPGPDDALADIAVLTVDMQLATWLPWLRVPLRRIPEQTYIPRDSEGFVRGPGLSEAVRAVTEPLVP